MPQGWREIPLGEVCETPVSGYSPVGADRPAKDDELGVLKLNCIQENRFSPDKNKAVAGSKINDLKTPVSKNTLIVSRSNTEELVGAVCYVEHDIPNLFLSDLLWRISAKDEKKVDLKWLSYLLSFSPYRAKILSRANGSSETMKKITKDGFLGIRILFPRIEEQKKIAQIISTWDIAADQTRKLIAAKRKNKKALLQQLLMGRTGRTGNRLPKGENDFVPPDWKCLQVKELFQTRSKKKCGDEPVLSVTQDLGIVLRETYARRIDCQTKDLSTFKLVEPGDFVISLRSFQGGIEYSNLKGIVSPAYHVFRPIREIDCMYYKYLFKSQDFINYLAIAVVGIRDGKQVSFRDFSCLYLPYPPINEQRVIGNVLLSIDNEIAVLEKKLGNIEKQKRGLMQKLLSGEVRVKI